MEPLLLPVEDLARLTEELQDSLQVARDLPPATLKEFLIACLLPTHPELRRIIEVDAGVLYQQLFAEPYDRERANVSLPPRDEVLIPPPSFLATEEGGEVGASLETSTADQGDADDGPVRVLNAWAGAPDMCSALMRRMLSKRNVPADITTALDRDELVRLATTTEFDLIVIETGPDGADVVAELTGRGVKASIIYLSPWPKDRDAASEAGAIALELPFTLGELRDALITTLHLELPGLSEEPGRQAVEEAATQLWQSFPDTLDALRDWPPTDVSTFLRFWVFRKRSEYRALMVLVPTRLYTALFGGVKTNSRS